MRDEGRGRVFVNACSSFIIINEYCVLVFLQGETFSGDSDIFPFVHTAFTFPSKISLFCGQLKVTSVPC